MFHLKALPFPLGLSSLASVEQRITNKFEAAQFDDLGNGSFLQFVAGHDRLREELGEGLVGAGSGAAHALAAKEKVLRIIAQLAGPLRENEVSDR